MQPVSRWIIYLTLLVALLCHLFPWEGRGIIPVSYTHLDVYKRQALNVLNTE